MRMHFGRYAFFALISAAFLGLSFAAGFFTREISLGLRPLGAGDFALLSEARNILVSHYLGDLPEPRHLEYGMIRGMLQTLDDPATTFVEPTASELESDDLQGEYGGIGVTLNRDEAGVTRLTPFPDSPASRAGVQDGDRLTAVDGTPIGPEVPTEAISALIRGPVGEAVVVGVERGGQALEFLIVRERLELPSVTWRIVEARPETGLLAISRFSVKTPGEVEHALNELVARGATQIVLDLRDNGGGLLDSGVKVAALFLDGGPVMHEVRRGEPERTFRAPSGGLGADLPMVVLVNHATASAAEIVAGAIRDRDRAPLIGQATYGKGSVQLVFQLADGSNLHVTAARWYTPDRQPIEGLGLKPDIEVESAEDADAPLARALEYLALADGK